MYRIAWRVFVFLLVARSAYAAEPANLVFAFQDVDNFPYEIGEGEEPIDMQKPGISIELLQSVAQRLHITIEFKRLPWKRCFIEMQKGSIDGIFSASFKPERLESGAYPMHAGAADPNRKIYTMSYMLYAPAGAAIRWDGSAFAPLPKKIAAIRGYSVIDDLKNMGIAVEEVKNAYVALKWLKTGTFEAAALLELAGDVALAAHRDELTNIVKLPQPLATRDYYLMLSHQLVRQSPQLAEDIWTTLRIVRESEEFQRSIRRYGTEERPE